MPEVLGLLMKKHFISEEVLSKKKKKELTSSMKLPIYRRYTEERSEDVESHSEALAPKI